MRLMIGSNRCNQEQRASSWPLQLPTSCWNVRSNQDKTGIGHKLTSGLDELKSFWIRRNVDYRSDYTYQITFQNKVQKCKSFLNSVSISMWGRRVWHGGWNGHGGFNDQKLFKDNTVFFVFIFYFAKSYHCATSCHVLFEMMLTLTVASAAVFASTIRGSKLGGIARDLTRIKQELKFSRKPFNGLETGVCLDWSPVGWRRLLPALVLHRVHSSVAQLHEFCEAD